MMMNSKFLCFDKDTEAELSARKNASMRELKKHKELIAEEFPEIEAIRLEIAELALDFAEKVIASPDDSEMLEKLAGEVIGAKEAELHRALTSNGFPPGFLELKPECPVCGDTGVVDGEMCACIKQFIIEKRFAGSGIDPDQRFETFRHDLIMDPKEHRASERICAYCADYADRFPENELNDLLLIGAPGIGKTFLLNSIGARALKNGHSVLKITANRMISSVLESIRDQEIPAPDYVFPELLIIDDLGTEPMINNITLETLLSVISERQDTGRATLIASNKSIEQLSEEYGERIMSRLISPQRVKVIKMNTPCIRVMKL